jgi:hypothetical protein
MRYTGHRAKTVGVACALAVLCAGVIAPAEAQTLASVKPSLVPERLGGTAALTVAVNFSSNDSGIPAPLRQSILWLPAGLSLDLPTLRSCSLERLRELGARGCPRAAEIGTGHARLAAQLGSLTVTENATISIFLGPPSNLTPTFELLGQGYTPIDERTVSVGTVRYANPPYGEELETPIAPIPTLALEPDASIVALSLTIGDHTTGDHTARRHRANAVMVPSRCPQGGFPFAAQFAYLDGSSSDTKATIPCPQPRQAG